MKLDQGAMAQAAHDKNVQERSDGGAGSGPQKGGGKGRQEISEKFKNAKPIDNDGGGDFLFGTTFGKSGASPTKLPAKNK